MLGPHHLKRPPLNFGAYPLDPSQTYSVVCLKPHLGLTSIKIARYTEMLAPSGFRSIGS